MTRIKKTASITPVRTRGAIRTRNEPDATPTPWPVRTRGTSRATRGGPAGQTPERRVPTLEQLVAELREDVGGLPLTTVVHGWPSQSSRDFLGLLAARLRSEDATWLIPDDDLSMPSDPTTPANAVLLDLNRNTEAGAYRNLFADLLFFSAATSNESKRVPDWRSRARALIVDCRGTEIDSVLQGVRKADLACYHWSGNTALNFPEGG